MAETWGECQGGRVVMERVTPETVMEAGIMTDALERGIERGTCVTADQPQWGIALIAGKAQALRTHRTFRACGRYEEMPANVTPFPPRNRKLVDRVRGDRDDH